MISLDQWKERAQAVKPTTKAFIDGEYRDALSGETFESVNPATGKLLANIASCDSGDVDLAVASARRAFENGSWRNMKRKDRKKVLLKFASLMETHQEELALLETLDMGKPIKESLNTDLPLSAQAISWFAETIDKQYDEVAPTDGNALATITREPMGVVVAVVPWNFPLLMAAWKLGPALAVGNSVILKPAEQSSLTALKLGEFANEAGIPKGVLNIVPGLGEKAGKALGLHQDVDAVAFTGSGEVGKLFLQYSAQSNMKRISLECGGKSPQIVMKDCPDLDVVATGIAWGIWYNQGEVCNAGSRLLVEESIKDELLSKVMEWGKKIYPGDPLDPTTLMGAIVDEPQYQKILRFIGEGKNEAKLLLGGNSVKRESGFFVEPTIFDNVQNNMSIARDEIFGPVLSVLPYRNLEDAIKVANDTDYGLAAAVWSKDISKANQTARALRAGTVWINCFDHGSIAVPFGGYKQSGFGRDKSLHALDKYTELKTTWVDLSV